MIKYKEYSNKTGGGTQKEYSNKTGGDLRMNSNLTEGIFTKIMDKNNRN